MKTRSLKDKFDHRGAKEAAGRAAVKLIHPGTLVGLGTGSTVAFFLQALGYLCRNGLQINGVASSKHTAELAEKEGIPLIDPDEVTFIDITVDGADEIDGKRQMIKGGGGALLREKIIASSSKEMIVIVDEAKCVKKLGAHPLPVEIVRFGAFATVAKLERLGYVGELRRDKSGELFVTDNGNLIIDIDLASGEGSPRLIDQSIRSVIGVVETGFFFDMATKVIVGFDDGRVDVRT